VLGVLIVFSPVILTEDDLTSDISLLVHRDFVRRKSYFRQSFVATNRKRRQYFPVACVESSIFINYNSQSAYSFLPVLCPLYLLLLYVAESVRLPGQTGFLFE
jgi:hypothetical protein